MTVRQAFDYASMAVIKKNNCNPFLLLPDIGTNDDNNINNNNNTNNTTNNNNDKYGNDPHNVKPFIDIVDGSLHMTPLSIPHNYHTSVVFFITIR